MPRSRSPSSRRTTATARPVKEATIMVTPSKRVSTPNKRSAAAGATSMKLGHSPMMGTLQYSIACLIISAILTYGVMKFGLVGKFVCPLIQKIYLMPLGLSALKTRGLIFLSLGYYALTTFFILPVISSLSVPLCCNKAWDATNPRQQRVALGGLCSRLGAAQANMVEGMILMVATIMTAMAAGVTDELLCEAMTFYLLMRKLYCVAFGMDIPMARSVCWLSGVWACFYMLYLSVNKFR